MLSIFKILSETFLAEEGMTPPLLIKKSIFLITPL